jgi:hypothetical protein
MKTIEQAAEFIREQTDKLDAPISYSAALVIAKNLHAQWEGRVDLYADVNVAQSRRLRYEGDNWEVYDD